MLNKDDLFLLRQASRILDKEEQRLKSIDVLDPKDIYYNNVKEADFAISQLLFHIDKDKTKVEPYWHEDLLANVRAGEFRKGRMYDARAMKEDHGEYTLTIFLRDTSEEDGWEYTNYIDTDCIREDILQLIAEGYHIELLTKLEEI